MVVAAFSTADDSAAVTVNVVPESPVNFMVKRFQLS